MIWAYGKSNEFGMHARRGATQFVLGGMCKSTSDCPQNSKCSAGACVAPGQPSQQKQQEWLEIDTGGLSMQIKYRIVDQVADFVVTAKGQVWYVGTDLKPTTFPEEETLNLTLCLHWYRLSFGLSESGSMAPAWAIVGQPGDSASKEFMLNGKSSSMISPVEQPLAQHGKVTYSQGTTTLAFRRLLGTESDKASGHAYKQILADGESNVIFAFGSDGTFANGHGPQSRGSSRVLWQSGTSSPQQLSDSAMDLAHGAFMLVAWLVLMPSGIFVARFFKDDDGVWFRRHKLLMGSGITLSMLGFFLILIGLSMSGSAHMRSSHAQFGLVITLLALLHPLLAAFRNRRRALWELQHKWMGRLLYFFAFINCFLGVGLISAKGSRLAFSLSICLFSLCAAGAFVRLSLLSGDSERPRDGGGGGDDDDDDGAGGAPRHEASPKMPWSPTPSEDSLPSWAKTAVKASEDLERM